MREIDKIIIHCSATREGQDVSVDTIRRWHVVDNGWDDIGYHYVISLDGSIHKGRPNNVQGAHTKGHNKNSIGICYIGGCDKDMNPKDTRTEAQKESLEILLEGLIGIYAVDNLIGIHGHNEFSDKACPSFDVQEEYGHL
jgi:N-acetylmuramoyl-L-alanine amidase